MTTETATNLRPFDQGNELLDMLEAWLPDIDATLDERDLAVWRRTAGAADQRDDRPDRNLAVRAQPAIPSPRCAAS